jgi:branched-chain amino acid transport system ATP-binding protein
MSLLRGSTEDVAVDVSPLAPDVPILEVNELCASYGSYRALFGIDLKIPQSSIVALLGSNGAGKSTVARVVSGLVAATSGTVSFAGQDVTRLPAFKIARMGMVHVPEGRGIFSSLNVEENLLLSFRQRTGRKNVAACLERAYTSFPILAERRTQIAGTLSGGQQRILALSRVLATPPRLLIVDELSLGLAPVIIDSVYEALVAICKTGCAILVVEQQVDRALAIADQAVLLAHGLVAWSGSPKDAADAMESLLGGRLIAAAEAEAAGVAEADASDGAWSPGFSGSSEPATAAVMEVDEITITDGPVGPSMPGPGDSKPGVNGLGHLDTQGAAQDLTAGSNGDSAGSHLQSNS